MALVPSSSLFPSNFLETSTFNLSSHFDYVNNSGVLDQQEPMNVPIPYLPGSNVGNPWPLLPAPAYPPTQQDWDNYRDIFTRLYQVQDRPLKEVKELLEQHYGFKATLVISPKAVANVGSDWADNYQR